MAFGQYLGYIGMVAGGVIGGVVGSIFPGIGTVTGITIGASLGGMLGGITGQVLWPEKIDLNLPPPPQPHEARAQVSTYGAPIPIVYESARLAGNIIYMQDVNQSVIRTSHRQDGVRYYEITSTYTSTFAVAFCEGPVAGVNRIWVNHKVFADFRDPAGPYYPTGSVALASANLITSIAMAATYFTIYTGTEAQTADPTLSALLTASETPAYRGICYVVFIDFPVGEFSGLPLIEIEIGPQMSADACSEYFEYADGALNSDIFTCPDTPGWVGDPPTIDTNRLKSYVGVPFEITERYLMGTYQFLGEFDYYSEFEISGSDYTYHTLYAAPDGLIGDWYISVETPNLGVGRYEASGDTGYGEIDMAGPATTGKLRLRRDASDNIYAYYWNASLARWEFDGDTSGVLLGTLSGAVAPAFDMRTMSMTALYVNDFVVTLGCDNTETFVYE